MSVLTRWGVLLFGVLLGGCSLILDPELCSTDSDCPVGVCQSGSCIIVDDSVVPTQGDAPSDPETGPSEAATDIPVEEPSIGGSSETPASDDSEVDAERSGGSELQGQAPECLIWAEENPTRLRELNVTVEVTDSDGPISELTVQFAGEMIQLNGAGQYTSRVAISDGENGFTLYAEDANGLSCEASLTVIGDHTAPELVDLSPAANAVVAQSVPDFVITGRVADRAIAQILDVWLNGAPWDGGQVEWNDDAFELRMALPTGEHILEIGGLDSAGNRSSRIPYELIYDATPPVISVGGVDARTSITHTSRRFELRGRVNDNGEPIAEAELRIDVSGEGQVRNYTAESRLGGHFSESIELFDGQNNVVVCGSDLAGNQSCTAPFQIFRQTPCVVVEQPMSSVIVGQSSILVTGTVCQGVRLVEASAEPEETGARAPDVVAGTISGTRFLVSVPLRTPGAQTILLTASNQDGETATATVQLVYDPSAPEIRDVTPADGACRGRDLQVCARIVEDLSALSNVTINGVTLRAGSDGLFCRSIAEPTSTSEVEATIEATNTAGGISYLRRQFMVDLDGPNVRIEDGGSLIGDVTWYAAGISGSIPIVGRVVDQVCGAASFTVGQQTIPLGPDGHFSSTLNLAAGIHALQYSAEDAVGNESTGLLRLGIDEEGPTVEAFQPTADQWVTESPYTVTINIDDEGSGTELATVKVCPANSNECTVNSAWKTPRAGQNAWQAELVLAPGLNTITVDATDRVGQTGQRIQTIRYDAMEPSLVIDAPQTGAFVRWPFHLSGTAADAPGGSGVTAVEVNGRAADQFDSQTGAWSHQVTPDVFGSRSIQVVGIDAAGLTSVPRNIEVNVGIFGQDAAAARHSYDDTPGLMTFMQAEEETPYLVIAGRSASDASVAVDMSNPDSEMLSLFPEVTDLSGVSAFLVRDLNNDGASEMVVALEDEGFLFEQAAGGTLFRTPSAFDAAVGGHAIAAGLLNDDPYEDIVVLSDLPNILLGRAEGGFDVVGVDEIGEMVTIAPDSPHDFDHLRFVENDVNVNTGRRVVESWILWRDDAFGIWNWNNEEGCFCTSFVLEIPEADVQDVVIFDHDGDGHSELLLIQSGRVRLWKFNNDGVWEDAMANVTPPNGIIRTLTTDFDQNGRDDVLVFSTSGVAVWRSVANDLNSVVLAESGLPFGTAISEGALQDLDGDGDDDLVLLIEGKLEVHWSNSEESGRTVP